ncbi:aspartyl protease family protein [Sphingomicrobium nitratireducens]|uniref:aspartyl protease family protein n=1 Tax=Sphingomicrobium nitratireducens TaxID=2964666 RepID=UPI00223FAF69|nr:aspartyl protease family protein [Sphingomicrobium nitratireducens]
MTMTAAFAYLGALLASASDPPAYDSQTIKEAIEDGRLLKFQVDPHDRMTLPIEVTGGETLDFMIDTGAERSAISAEAARLLGYETLGEKTVVSFAGRASVETVNIPSIRVSRRVLHDLEALKFREAAIGADGLLGIDSLADQFVTFDFDDREMRLGKAPKFRTKGRRDEVVVDLVERDGRMVMSNAQVGKTRLDVMIDTGSGISIGNQMLKRELMASGKIKRLRRLAMLTVTGEIVPIDYGLLRDVEIDGITILRMPIAFALSEPFEELGLADRPTLLLGMDVLRSFSEMSIDFRNRRAHFRAANASQYKPGALWGFVDRN